MAREFKVGDKVKVVSHKVYSRIGLTGTIVELSRTEIDLKMDNKFLNHEINGKEVDKDFYYYVEDLVLLIKDSKIARKLYPNAKPTDDGWLEV